MKPNHQEHMGFCLDWYNEEICADCPTEAECLTLWERERDADRNGDPNDDEKVRLPRRAGKVPEV